MRMPPAAEPILQRSSYSTSKNRFIRFPVKDEVHLKMRRSYLSVRRSYLDMLKRRHEINALQLAVTKHL